MKSATSSKAALFDLYEQDRAALALIRNKLELNSNALAVRIAIRNLARRLAKPGVLDDTETIPSTNHLTEQGDK